ncbi:HNH endonuclease signature motif containing protein [Vibrio lentus]|uniref:HNH endonuclease signature motif containing protein n=1 Tax=Vibrio lentus TaxID=136468 RepID=UPI0023ED1880|nr:HNH endonuclease signature motif containing protein [Vibrio lentus]
MYSQSALTLKNNNGADCLENVIALCPTCHREAHDSVDAADFNAKLIKKALKIEEQLL